MTAPAACGDIQSTGSLGRSPRGEMIAKRTKLATSDRPLITTMSTKNAPRRAPKDASLSFSMPGVSALACRRSAALGTIGASVLGAVGSHLFPSRTQQLSPPAPKILGTSVPGEIGQGRDLKRLRRESVEVVLLFRRFCCERRRLVARPLGLRSSPRASGSAGCDHVTRRPDQQVPGARPAEGM